MRLLIPVDGSAASTAALDFITSRASHLGSHPDLRLLNVQYPIPPRAARAVGREIVRSFHQAEADAPVRSPASAMTVPRSVCRHTNFPHGPLPFSAP